MDKKIIAIIVAFIAIVAIGGYFLLGGGSDNVTIGYLPSDHDAALFVADAQGQYAKNGINTKLVQFNNGGDLMTAMASGEVDVGYVGITPVLSSIEKGVPVKVISAAQTEGSGIVVAKNSGINSVFDLEGKKIATPGEASIQHMLLQYYLKQNGIDIKDVKVSAMKVPSMNDALKTNNIDGMITFEPYVSIAEKNGAKVLVDSSEILPNHPCCVVVASDKFLDEHPNETQKILDIHKNATDYINNNTDEAAELLPSDIVSDVDVEKQALAGFPFISGLNDTYKQNVMEFMNLEVELGVLKKPLSEDKIFWNGS
ncbi:MAG: ABC transporter substrate-binding protein [archaeon]|uniref:NitT/TauT family transport system substrate-binding protein n=1 Tax=Methanobrevibacter gottschalkii DSM 11977 TaxID=1122229 RepID=A0A3N5BPJ7_9EURY|nr:MULTISPECIES: ABC transporter substrate-binding protein [Methanobrevibacter]MCQ2971115.1 ABC transporter substrate-binding protein [archaeon]OEC99557.1 nitrate ABC transporter substrate-binding protein [Methanobrevibacter sp. A27]RPF51698.1 NitT/TauT family transport system substrate-binding protein [Methanobrevibacter gottschalkii DSM 11977]